MLIFRFRLIPCLVTVLLVALGCALAYWQSQRAQHKEAIEAKLHIRENTPPINLPLAIDINQMEYTRVILKGEFLQDWPIYLDNRPMNGAAGIVVWMPFKLQDRPNYVLVARGWVPRNLHDRTAIRPYSTPAGLVHIEGILKANSGRVLQFDSSAPLRPKALVQNIEVDALATASHLPIYPFVVEQTSDLQDGLLRNWSRASSGSERHRGYAFQWLALAIMALIFFLVTGFKYERK